jgi:hypothetical protein
MKKKNKMKKEPNATTAAPALISRCLPGMFAPLSFSFFRGPGV